MSVCLLLLLFRLQFFTYKFSTSCPARRGENALNILEVCVLQTDMYKYIFPLEHTHTHMHIMHSDCKSFQPSPAQSSPSVWQGTTWRHVNAIYLYIYVYICICRVQLCLHLRLATLYMQHGTRYKFVHKHFVEITIKNMFQHRQKPSKLHF